MPTPVYMDIAEAPGSVEIAGREATIEIIEMDHDVHIPTDIHSGRSSGVRQHGRMTVRAAVDSATPMLYKAVTEGMTFPEVLFHFYQIDDTGTEVEYYTITMERVKVAAVKLDVPNVKNTLKEHYPHMVEYSFVYGAITWTFVDGAIEHTDDWVAAR
ncbi:MAG: type VI secretion system tube protein TssD [Bacteroidota bacterium]